MRFLSRNQRKPIKTTSTQSSSSSSQAHTTNTRSRHVRVSIVRSLQPLQEKYPELFPPELQFTQQKQSSNYGGYTRSHIFPQQRYRQLKKFLDPRPSYPISPFSSPHINNYNYNNYSTASLAATAAASAVPAVSTTGSFFKYLLIFTAGGLFFSSVIAVFYAFYGIGVTNTRRIFGIFTLVLQRVWISFTAGLGEARLALLGKDIDREEERGDLDITDPTATSMESATATVEPDEYTTKDSTSSAQDKKQQRRGRKRWKIKRAWQVLKEQLSETRRTAAEGYQAIRQEQTLYTGIIGQPGLSLPNFFITKLLPFSVSTILENAFRDTLKNAKPSSAIKKMVLTDFKAGRMPPRLEAARIYDVKDAIAFDMDLDWDSQMEATFQIFTAGGLARIPVSIKNIKFSGVVRMVLTPLTPDPPGYGATLLSFPTAPQFSLEVKILGGEVTKVPFLKNEITSTIQKSIRDQLIWPRRNVIPMLVQGRRILDNKELAALKTDDPLLREERRLANSTQTIVRDIREKLQPMNDPTKQDFSISILPDADTNVTFANLTNKEGKKKRWRWRKWGSGQGSNDLSLDNVMDVNGTFTNETNASKNEPNITYTSDDTAGVHGVFTTMWEDFSRFFRIHTDQNGMPTLPGLEDDGNDEKEKSKKDDAKQLTEA